MGDKTDNSSILLQRAMSLSERAMERGNSSDATLTWCRSAEHMMKTYAIAHEAEYHDQVQKYNLMTLAKMAETETEPDVEPEFKLPGEDPLVNPNN
jgi:hypothetical protein